MGTWHNNDGLYVKFGSSEGQLSNAGQYNTDLDQVTEAVIEFGDIGSSASIVSDVVELPVGAAISKVVLIAEEAFTSAGAATLDIGLIREDRSTELDYNGLVAALALTSIDAVGDRVELIQGSTGHGALVGTVLANKGYLTVNYGTAAYTAGRLVVRVHWYMPAADVNSVA